MEQGQPGAALRPSKRKAAIAGRPGAGGARDPRADPWPPLTPAPATLLTLLSAGVKRPLPVEGDAWNSKKPSQLSAGPASGWSRASAAREGAEALGGPLRGAPTGWRAHPRACPAHTRLATAPCGPSCSGVLTIGASALGGGGGAPRHEPSLPTGESHHFLNMILSKMAHPILPARQTAVQMHRFKNLFSALTLQKLKSPFPL